MRFLTLPLIALAIACSMAQAQSAPTQQPATALPGAGAAVQPAERPNGQADEIQPTRVLTQQPDQPAGKTPAPATGATEKPQPKAKPPVNSIVSQLTGQERDCLPEAIPDRPGPDGRPAAGAVARGVAAGARLDGRGGSLARIHRWTRTEGVRTQEGGVRKLQTRWPGLEFG